MISLGSFSGPPNLCFRSVASIKVVPKPSNPPGSIFTLLKTLDKPIVDPGLKSDWYKFSFCSPESMSPQHHIMCAILQLRETREYGNITLYSHSATITRQNPSRVGSNHPDHHVGNHRLQSSPPHHHEAPLLHSPSQMLATLASWASPGDGYSSVTSFQN